MKLTQHRAHTTHVSAPAHFFAPNIQPKFTVNTPGDAYEQEADRVADQVMRMGEGDPPIVQRMALTAIPGVQRKCAKCEQEEQAQRKETGSAAGGFAAPPIVHQTLSGGSSQPMDAGTRQFMESRFGQDFSHVRIHTDSRAAESAAAIQARAYTLGRNIVFGQGQYQPGNEEGRRLLAHELAHVGQQGGGQGAIQRACASGSWQFEYDGCSVPQTLSDFLRIDKDNPAGGADTHFGSNTGASLGLPCDLHDECYQTCGSNQAQCDEAMYAHMLQVCNNSRGAPTVRTKCREWAGRYYRALRLFGRRAHSERQQMVCSCP